MRLASWPAAVAMALLAGLAPAASTAAAAAGPPARAGAVTNDKFRLNAVSALSSSDAWAVGNGATTLHWNGASWAPVALPGENAIADGLSAVDALSPSDVWAVGEQVASPSQVTTTLIVHWNGTAWAQVKSPGPSNSNLIPTLDYLSMDSAADGWATGRVFNRTTGALTPLVLHWNGTSWQQVTTKPQFGFRGVASLSPTDATAVVEKQIAKLTFVPEVFHWNGTSWAATATLPSPSGVPASRAFALGLSADSATDMWAAGGYHSTSVTKNLAWHWNGTSWTVTAVPTAIYNGSPIYGGLLGVAAISQDNVWAVGYGNAPKYQEPVSMHWNGTRWAQVATPNPGLEDAVLNEVVAAGPGNIWAVGYYTSGFRGSVSHTLILRWDDTSWVQS